jgi:hypothetical protein
MKSKKGATSPRGSTLLIIASRVKSRAKTDRVAIFWNHPVRIMTPIEHPCANCTIIPSTIGE